VRGCLWRSSHPLHATNTITLTAGPRFILFSSSVLTLYKKKYIYDDENGNTATSTKKIIVPTSTARRYSTSTVRYSTTFGSSSVGVAPDFLITLTIFPTNQKPTPRPQALEATHSTPNPLPTPYTGNMGGTEGFRTVAYFVNWVSLSTKTPKFRNLTNFRAFMGGSISLKQYPPTN
jgi:hypothetical protein